VTLVKPGGNQTEGFRASCRFEPWKTLEIGGHTYVPFGTVQQLAVAAVAVFRLVPRTDGTSSRRSQESEVWIYEISPSRKSEQGGGVVVIQDFASLMSWCCHLLQRCNPL